MKALILVASLFAAQTTIAMDMNSADIVCRTQPIGEIQRQVSVYVFHKGAHSEAMVTQTSLVGRYAPIYFDRVLPYAMNGSLTYINQHPGSNSQIIFNLTVPNTKRGKGLLRVGRELLNVTCVSVIDPIIAI